MSLLMDALKKAEEAKQRAGEPASPQPQTTSAESVTPAAASPLPPHSRLPDLLLHADAVDADLAAVSSEAPASLSKVGYQSTMCIGCAIALPGWMRPCQATQAQTRVPPSYTVPLPARSGPLLVTWPGCGPPLSLEKKISVFVRKPRSSSAARI